MKEVTCTNCGWVGVLVTREFAEREIERFNSWFDKQPQKTKDCFGGKPSSLKNYACMRCGKFGPYRDSMPKDSPIGCTLGSVIEGSP